MTDHESVSITVILDLDADLTIRDVWPDGDAPEVITAEAVKAVMEESGSKALVLADWMLLEDLRVTVVVDTPNPAWSPDPPLFEGFEVEQWVQSTAEVWE